ncbi:hypothetical protein [Lysinibacillus sp. FW12]|uniref:hypothetical protein n=1 Tax=Lysinibacillus sp. FW12 TaxID=3096079 RepID=UPI003D707ED2
MEYSRSSKVGAVEIYETFEGDVDEIAELNDVLSSRKALTIKEPETKPDFSDSKHVSMIGIESNKSEINYHDFSYLDLRIVFSANSPQETDLALCEIVEKATKFFRVTSSDGYQFKMPGEEEKSIVEMINECSETATIQASNIEFNQWKTEIAKLAKRNIDIGLLKELNSHGPKGITEISALNSLTDEEFDKYCELYREKEK